MKYFLQEERNTQTEDTVKIVASWFLDYICISCRVEARVLAVNVSKATQEINLEHHPIIFTVSIV